MRKYVSSADALFQFLGRTPSFVQKRTNPTETIPFPEHPEELVFPEKHPFDSSGFHRSANNVIIERWGQYKVFFLRCGTVAKLCAGLPWWQLWC